MTHSSNKRSILLAVGAVLLWCWSGVCFRKGSELVGTGVYLTFMTGGGALTAVVLQLVRGQPLSDLYRLPGRMIVFGFMGVTLYTLALAFAFGLAPATDIGQINLLNYLWPVWMVVLGFLFLPDRPKPIFAIPGILMGLLGVLISRGFGSVTHLPSDILPPALATIGAFFWALYNVLLKKWEIPQKKSGTAFHFAICAILAGLGAVYLKQWQNLPPWSGPMVFWIVFGAVGPVGIAYFFYEMSVKSGPVPVIASISFFIPIGSSLLIGLFFKETMNMGLLFGAVLIAVGSWLVHKAVNKNANGHAR